MVLVQMNSSQKTTRSHSKTQKFFVSFPINFVMFRFINRLTLKIFTFLIFITYLLLIIVIKLLISYFLFESKIANFIMRVPVILFELVAHVNVPLVDCLKVPNQPCKLPFFLRWYFTFLFLYSDFSLQISVFNDLQQIQS